MITPFQKDDQLLQDIRRADASGQTFSLWWLGQSGFLVKFCDHCLLFDPYLSDSLTQKYSETDKPHVRMTELVIDPRKLDFVQVVTSTHNHTDHLDGETLEALLEVNPTMKLVVAAANHEFAAARAGVQKSRVSTVDVGGVVESGPFRIQAVPAAHEQIERDPGGRYRCIGFVVEFGEWCVYHSGDTIRYAGMKERLSQFAIDVAILPINGRLPERKVPGNLWGHEAAQLACDIGAGVVIPCHFEMFEFNTVDPGRFIECAERLSQPFCVLRCGERWSSHESSSGTQA